MPKRSLGIKTRFSLVLVILAFSLIAVGAAGIVGLRAERGNASRLYLNNVQTAEDASNLGANLDIAHAATLELLLDLGHSAATAPVSEQLQSGISTDVDLGIASVRPLIVTNARETQAINTIANGWSHLQDLRASGGLSNGSPSALATEVNEVESTYDPMTAAANTIVRVEGIQARAAYQSSLASYGESVHLMILAIFLGLLIALGMVAFLTRSVLARTLSYSAF